MQIREEVLGPVGGGDPKALRSLREGPTRRDRYAQEANRSGEPLQRGSRVVLEKCPTGQLPYRRTHYTLHCSCAYRLQTALLSDCPLFAPMCTYNIVCT